MTGFLHDLRLALRQLRLRPGFSALAIGMLALGIGATTGVFSVVYSVLLRPHPFPDADALVHVWETRAARGWNRAAVTPANFRDLREQNSAFVDLGAFRSVSVNLAGTEYPERIHAGLVTSGFFSRILGVRLALGRDFLPEEDDAGATGRVAILGYAMWRDRFGQDRNVIGRPLVLNGEAYTVVGVLPPGTPWLDEADVFGPMVPRPDDSRTSFELAVIGRLKPGVTLAAGRADLERVAARLAELHPKDDAGMGINVAGPETWGAGEGVRRAVVVLLAAVAFLLLIACANVANLLLAVASGRSRETAIRTALGASAARLVRLGLSESLLLALLGAAGGMALCALALRALRALDPGAIPGLVYVGVNGWILAFAIGAGVLTGVLTGLLPALQAAFTQPEATLRGGGEGVTGGRGTKRLRAGLVLAEVASSVVLVVGAGLLVRSFTQLLRVDLGFEVDSRLVAAVNLPESYGTAEQERFLRQFLARVREVPGVRDAGAISSRPMIGNYTSLGIVRPDDRKPSGGTPQAQWRLVTPGYLETMRIPLRAGRVVTESDVLVDPSRALNRVVISERLAKQLWPGESAVGRTAILWAGQDDIPAEIAGVVGDVREEGLDAAASLAVYIPYYGHDRWSPTFVIHTSGDPLAIVPALRGILRQLDPTLPLSSIRTLEQVVGRSVASRRFALALMGAFATIALLLAMAGVYGVQAYSVARQAPDIAVRVALGAQPGQVLRPLVLRAMWPALAGIVVGLAGAMALSRVIGSMLFEVRAVDPATYAVAAALLVATALASCWLPARRALRVDPVSALRSG